MEKTFKKLAALGVARRGKTGGGDGNRTHVRIIAERKRYMLISLLILTTITRELEY